MLYAPPTFTKTCKDTHAHAHTDLHAHIHIRAHQVVQCGVVVQLAAVSHEALLPSERISQRQTQDPHFQVGWALERACLGLRLLWAAADYHCYYHLVVWPASAAQLRRHRWPGPAWLWPASPPVPCTQGHGGIAPACSLSSPTCHQRLRGHIAAPGANWAPGTPHSFRAAASTSPPTGVASLVHQQGAGELIPSLHPPNRQADFAPGERILALLLRADRKSLRLTTMELEEQVRSPGLAWIAVVVWWGAVPSNGFSKGLHAAHPTTTTRHQASAAAAARVAGLLGLRGRGPAQQGAATRVKSPNLHTQTPHRPQPRTRSLGTC